MQKNEQLYNEDLAPVSAEKRNWGVLDLAALWVGMAVCIPTYMLAAGLIKGGMNWWQALLTIMLGNLIVLVPMALNGHAGTKYGVPLPVLLRSSFGVFGTNIPSLMRGLVACGWFGIQTWIGGAAIYGLAKVAIGIDKMDTGVLPFLGITLLQFVCFLIFWAINIAVILKGIDSIRWLEEWAAPFLIIVGLALLGWGVVQGGGFSVIFDQEVVRKVRGYRMTLPEKNLSDIQGANLSAKLRERLIKEIKLPKEAVFSIAPTTKERWLITARYDKAKKPRTHLLLVVQTQQKALAFYDWNQDDRFNFWAFFFPMLTAMIGFWSTLALNIPDFTRYAKSQREQVLGQALGLPTTMTLFSFIGIAVTAATVVVFGEAIWDPVDLLARFTSPVIVGISLIGLTIATLSTNIAANVVAPANGFSNLAPSKISFKMGGLLTGLIGIVIMPWRLLSDMGGYIFTWLIGYSALLGAIAGVMFADYFVIRKTVLDVDALYEPNGEYAYGGSGYNWRALVALFLGILPNIPGFLQAASNGSYQAAWFFNTLYTYAWFVSLFVAGAAHILLTTFFPPNKQR